MMYPGYCTQHRNESKESKESKEKDEKARDKKMM